MKCANSDFIIPASDEGDGMNIQTLAIEGPLLITPSRHGDSRGYFSEVFRADVFEHHAPGFRFVQDNHSLSALKGTVRGLHYQKSPRAQGKLVRVGRGTILDVAVDARSGSASFGQHVAVELSGENRQQLWVPPGFLHGFCTLTEAAEVLYKVTEYFSAPHDAGVRWNDPALGIPWPVHEADVIVSEKDRTAPLFAEMGDVFGSAS
jgi:dTDP-4-dehydrorhamnose 3,5-epimerase